MNIYRVLIGSFLVLTVIMGFYLLSSPAPQAPALPTPVAIPGKNPTPSPLVDISGEISQPPGSPEAEPPAFDGEQAIGDIIADQSITTETAALKLMEILPRLNEKEQAEAAQHISNLSDEKVAARWAAELAGNRLPPAASEVLIAALYNQPQELFLPTMASIADQPHHPRHQEAVDALDLLVGPLPDNSTWTSLVQQNLATRSP